MMIAGVNIGRPPSESVGGSAERPAPSWRAIATRLRRRRRRPSRRAPPGPRRLRRSAAWPTSPSPPRRPAASCRAASVEAGRASPSTPTSRPPPRRPTPPRGRPGGVEAARHDVCRPTASAANASSSPCSSWLSRRRLRRIAEALSSRELGGGALNARVVFPAPPPRGGAGGVGLVGHRHQRLRRDRRLGAPPPSPLR
jgi:hypothetical protein